MTGLPHFAPAGLRRAGGAILGLLLPPRCLVCGGVVEGAGAVCGACWPAINFLAPPHCAACGYPFAYHAGDGVLCGACTRKRPPYGRARSVLAYDEGSRDPVLAFKHRDRTDAAPAFGTWLARAGAELLEDADLLVPVPLHPTRLLGRRYNQSALLVHALSKVSGVPAAIDLMVRTRRTPSQGRLSAAARRRNVAGAFAVRRGMDGRLRDRGGAGG